METLEKIKQLQKDRGWSVYRLAEESGLTQSTLANMFARNTEPSLKTLRALCEAFGISLASFFSDGETTTFISSDESKLVALFQTLNPKQKKALTIFLEAFCQNDQV